MSSDSSSPNAPFRDVGQTEDRSGSTRRRRLQQRLARARAESDSLFAMLAPEAVPQRPIRERHRVIFYLGHIEAFDWNLIARTVMNRDTFNEDFDRLFAFGIDPVGGGLPTDSPGDWPSIPEIEQYNRRTRSSVDEILETTDFSGSPDLEDGLVFEVALEHRLMHVETLAYMLHWLEPDLKRAQASDAGRPGRRQPRDRVSIPAGPATLGRTRGSGFGWDNEFEEVEVGVTDFDIDRHDVTNGEYLEFVRSGAYDDATFWTGQDWEWKRREGVSHPRFWEQKGDRWFVRTMFDRRPLEVDWPVYVSHAEAAAFARWSGRRLPTEAEFHRAAYGSPRGGEREFPWGSEPPGPEHGNFSCRWWNPTPVGAFPGGDSAFGVADLVGNGWEWTSTPFAAFAGFEPFSFYAGYSADFFDGQHYVMKGGSPRTASPMLRRSFRNWFQPHYPNIYATFRTVSS